MARVQLQNEISVEVGPKNMTCAQQAISPEQWIDYVEGLAASTETIRIDTHLHQCPACRETLARLVQSRDALRTAAHRHIVPDTTAARLWDSVCFRIRRFVGQDQPEHAAVDIRQLRSILISMCGETAAEGALHNASVSSGEKLDKTFARNLGSVVEVMCGTRAARFVEHAAQSTRTDKVA